MLKSIVLRGGIIAMACSVSLIDARAADGDLDTSFGLDGISRFGINDADPGPTGCRPTLDAEGRILTCGTRRMNGATGSDFFVARFDADGHIDPTFGNNGFATIDFDGGTGGDQAAGMALDSSGRIVVAGSTRGAGLQSSDFAVARLSPDGTLDTTFGDVGKAIVAFDLDEGTGNDTVRAVAIGPDGSIILAGSAETSKGCVVAVARLLVNGSRDPGFSESGRQTFVFDLVGVTDETDSANGIAIDDAGRIIVAGTADASLPLDVAEFGVARLLPGGELDETFADGGRTTVGFDPGTGMSNALALGVIIQRDGRIVVNGYANTSPWANQNMDMAAARLLPDGTLDASFGTDGRITMGVDKEADGFDAAIAAVERDDGRLVFVGTALGADTQYGVAARFGSGGTVDPTFGDAGLKTYDFGFSAPGTQAFTGTALEDGRILIGGVAFVPPLGNPQPLDYFIVRLDEAAVDTDTIFAAGFE